MRLPERPARALPADAGGTRRRRTLARHARHDLSTARSALVAGAELDVGRKRLLQTVRADEAELDRVALAGCGEVAALPFQDLSRAERRSRAAAHGAGERG